MLKHGEANPLAVWGLREIDHCPPHFTPVDFEIYANDKLIRDWIWANLEGRFYFGPHYYRDQETKKIAMIKRAAFELPGEASMFALILAHINKTDWLI
jgi:hypothetical protein